MDWVSTVAEITGCICQDRDSSKDSGSCTRSSANFLVGPWEGPSAYLWSVLGSFPPEPKLPLDQSQRKAECQARLWLEGVGAFIPFSQEPRGWGTTLPHSSGVQPHSLSSCFGLHWQVSQALKPPTKTQVQPTSLSSCVARFNK